MVQRLTYSRRHCYNTKSNAVRIIKTPGGKLAFQYRSKLGSVPKCGDCKEELRGMSCVRPSALRGLKKRQRSVTRAYGGSRCGGCVRNRIIRAFLLEEQKIVKEVIKKRSGEEKSSKKKK